MREKSLEFSRERGNHGIVTGTMGRTPDGQLSGWETLTTGDQRFLSFSMLIGIGVGESRRFWRERRVSSLYNVCARAIWRRGFDFGC